MSKKNYTQTQTTETPEVNETEGTETETTVSQETEAQTDQTAVEETVDETVVETTESGETSETVVLDEQAQLMKELGLRPMGVNVMKNKEIQPSTPLLRRMKEQQERSKLNTEGKQDIEEMIIQKFGAEVLQDPQVKYVLDTVCNYAEVMSPNRAVNEQLGGEQQEKLARLYDAVLNYNPDLSNLCLKIIVEVAKANRDLAFNERYALRFINVVRLNQTYSLRFQMLQTLFVNLAAETSAKDIHKVVNVRKLLDYITDSNAKANLSDFLS